MRKPCACFSPITKPKSSTKKRAAGRKLITQAKAKKNNGKILIYVNNRLEGNALETIAAMVA